MLSYYLLDWLAIVTTLLAVWMLGQKNRQGFLVFVFSNLCWVGVGIMTASLAIILGNLAFLAMNLRGWWRWGQDETPAPAVPD